MKLSRLSAVALVALGCGTITLGGCRNDDDDMYSDRPRDRLEEGEVRPVADPTPFDTAMRDARLREAGVPDDVRGMILQDLGDLQVADAELRTTEASGPMYRVVYIVEGKPHERWYNANGQRLQQPPPQPAETINPQTAAERMALPPTTRPADQPPPGDRPDGA